MPTSEQMPQTLTFDRGLEFMETNKDKDNWFLQIETFDPHEPFFSHEEYQKLYPHDYSGNFFDWPDYRDVTEEDEAVQHIRCQYAALLSMCDDNLGRVLDMMDRNDMWKDTMLIVNTDHGYMLGEHGHWAKCFFPFYNEIAHTLLFIWDPRLGVKNKRVYSLTQTIDLPATILEFFGLPLTQDMQGRPLRDVMLYDKPVRDYAMWGVFGGQINITDGKTILMRSPKPENQPLYQYTLMPTCHGSSYWRAFIDKDEMKTMTAAPPFSFTKEMPVMKISNNSNLRQFSFPTRMYDLDGDPLQQHPVEDPERLAALEALMRRAMRENDCPEEQFERMGL